MSDESLNGSSLPVLPFKEAATHEYRKIPVTTYNIHEILDETKYCPVTLGKLQHLIHCQANLHMADSKNDSKRLKELLDKRKNTLRGFVLYGEEVGEIGYLIYYPMIGPKGERVAYCEDFYIAESYRYGKGTGDIMFHELAKRAIADDFEYVQWATDKRNEPVHSYVQKKLGAKHPNVLTISTSTLLGGDDLTSHWANKDYETRALEPNDVELPKILGLSPNIIRRNGDHPFKGFITFDKSKPGKPVIAITPGWTHLSTFQLKEGLHLEQPVFATDCDQAGVVSSIVQASRSYTKKNKLAYFRWHIDGGESSMKVLLQDKLGLPRDSMLKDRPETELIVYKLSNGELTALAENNPGNVLKIPVNDPIGMRANNPQRLPSPAPAPDKAA